MAGIFRSSRRAAALALALVCACVSASSSASAAGHDTPKPLAQSLVGTAREDYDAARTLFAHDDFSGAAIKFRSAYDRSHDVRLLWNIASCEHKMRHYARTRQLLERYTQEGGASLSDQDRRDADGVLKAIEPFVSTVKLTAKPDGSDVVVDGESVGQTPLANPIYVDLGKHEIVVRKDGFKRGSKSVSATGGESLLLQLELEAAPHEGLLEVRAGRDDLISLDGQSLGIGSVSKTVSSGHHTLRVSSAGHEARSVEVVVEDDKTKSIDLRASPQSGSSTTTWLITGGAIALVAGGLAIGAYFLFRPSSAPQPTNGTLGGVELP